MTCGFDLKRLILKKKMYTFETKFTILLYEIAIYLTQQHLFIILYVVIYWTFVWLINLFKKKNIVDLILAQARSLF